MWLRGLSISRKVQFAIYKNGNGTRLDFADAGNHTLKAVGRSSLSASTSPIKMMALFPFSKSIHPSCYYINGTVRKIPLNCGEIPSLQIS